MKPQSSMKLSLVIKQLPQALYIMFLFEQEIESSFKTLRE